MKFHSTRSEKPLVSFRDCLTQGLAKDGGLFVPESFPAIDFDSKTLAELGAKILKAFIGEDLESICKSTFNFPIPLRHLDSDFSVLELFHGPTAAFKDFGARFLSHYLVGKTSGIVLVATSGDTGGAVAAAFFKKPGFRVVVLYPKGKISARQERQIACWGENITALSVNGDFDDCQKMVKAVLLKKEFISANSISLGRLLPQMVYFAFSSLEFKRQKKMHCNFIIPTGNLGNAVSCLMAKRLGFPIGKVVLSTNANDSIGSYFRTQTYKAHPTLSTLANAMDVGNPSNIERLFWLYTQFEDLKKDVSVVSVSDEQIKETIRAQAVGEVWCPHTATAVFAQQQLKVKNAVVVATAHPAKFETIVEPLIGRTLKVPEALAGLLERPNQSIEIDAHVEALESELTR